MICLRSCGVGSIVYPATPGDNSFCYASDMLADVRRLRLIALLPLVLLVAASASYTSGYTLEIVDNEGRPHVAYALYRHQGHWLNPVHPVSYNATERTFVRSEDE